MSDRRDVEPTEYKRLLKAYHKKSDRHVLVLEADISHQDKCKIFHYADLERKAGNELVAIMKNNYEQLTRTKRYRNLKELYGEYAGADDETNAKAIAVQLKDMQKQYNVTWDYCRTSMIPIGKKYGIDAVFALTKAEDIWRGIEKCLYADGKAIHFSKRDDLPSIRAKQPNRGIVISASDKNLRFKFNGIHFGALIRDRFEKDEVNAVLEYLADSDTKDCQAIEALNKDGIYMSTYRPCCASLVCKKIRGKLRVYIHITIEGLAKPKYNKYGKHKHKFGNGVVGCDIGTQTIAYTSNSEIGLKNLAERGSAISTNERKERLIYRSMDRSRRAANPQNYNSDGTIKKGRKTWTNSKRYMRLKNKHADLCRINSINRHLAINEDVNRLRSLGDIFVTESKNAKKLQKRAKKTTTNDNGKAKRKKRFGKSIKNRCPGYFQAQVEKKFCNTGGSYIEVPNNYRASQYDHTADDYIKKKLSDRMYNLSDGTRVQRDWYSSFLLYNIDLENYTIDRKKCLDNFKQHYTKEQTLVEWIKDSNIKVLNSSIKIA